VPDARVRAAKQFASHSFSKPIVKDEWCVKVFNSSVEKCVEKGRPRIEIMRQHAVSPLCTTSVQPSRFAEIFFRSDNRKLFLLGNLEGKLSKMEKCR
jgi:hypothetical protein